MKKIIFILIFSFVYLAQNHCFSATLIDSLESRLPKTKDKEKLILLHDLIWEYYKINPARSVEYGDKAIQLSEELGDSVMLAYSYRYTGIAYKELGKFDFALQLYFKSLSIIEKTGTPLNLAKAYISIGNIYGDLDELEDAKSYLKRAIEIARQNEEYEMLSRTLMSLGIIYHRNNQMDSAFLFYEQSRQLTAELNITNDLAILYNNLGLYYSDLSEYDSALIFYRKSLKLREDMNNKFGMANLLSNIGSVFTYLGMYEEAIKNLEESQKISFEIGALELQKNNYIYLSFLYESMGNYEKSLSYHKLYHRFSDSIFNVESDRWITQMLATQKINEQIRNNEVLQESNKLQGKQISKQKSYSLILLVLVGATTMIIIFLFLLYRTKKRNLDLLSDVINSLTHPFYVINAKDYNIEFANTSAKKGDIPIEARCGFLKLKIDKPCGKDHCKCSLENLTATAKPYKVESRSIMKDGEERFYELYGFPVFDRKGKLDKIIEYNRDITDRKKAELALENSEKQLRLSNEAKDKLFSILAHDIRNPFTFMIGITETLLHHHDELDPAEIQEIYQKIYDTSSQTYKLFEHLMEWAQSQSNRLAFEPNRINLSSLVEENIDLLKVFAKEKQIALIAEHACDKQAFADENMVKTILRNLTLNAIKFTHNGGSVSIITKIVNRHVEVSVVDDGVGIPDDVKKNLFSLGKGVSTYGTAQEKGLGIGLILTRELVEKCKGRISVESEAGKGSRFTFTLPTKS